jgi:hypothetical protein
MLPGLGEGDGVVVMLPGLGEGDEEGPPGAGVADVSFPGAGAVLLPASVSLTAVRLSGPDSACVVDGEDVPAWALPFLATRVEVGFVAGFVGGFGEPASVQLGPFLKIPHNVLFADCFACGAAAKGVDDAGFVKFFSDDGALPS